MIKLFLILVVLLSLIIILINSQAFLYHLKDFNNFSFFTYLSMLGIWLFELIKIKSQNSYILYNSYNL